MTSRNKSNQPVTMEDVARAAGVSRMTVSRALRKDGPVTEKTRQRILSIVKKMNYVPDQVAGSLSTKRSGFVATLVPSLNNLHFAETVKAINEQVEAIDLQLLLGYTEYDRSREEKLVESMLRRRPEVIILPYDGHSKRTVSLLKQARVPVIELWEVPPKPIGYTVGFSNQEAAEKMTEALIEKGYRNIVFLSEADDKWTRGAARRKGFEQAMLKAGLSAEAMIRHGKPPISIEDGYQIGSELKSRFANADCIFCVSDAPAFGVISALKKQGIDVPGDVGVAGFGNFEISRFATPSISTVEVDPHRIGQETGKLIAQLLDQETDSDAIPIHTPVEITLSWRESTR